MAVITKIGGVATSGTTGVNNLFGSGGGGGTPNTTTAPSALSISASNTYGPQTLLIMAPTSGSYTQVTYNVTVENASGTVIIDNDEIIVDTANPVAHVATWSDSSPASDGTRTIRVKAQEFGDQYDSSELTATYTKSDVQFQYYRIYGSNVAGTPNASNIGIREMELYSGAGQSGTKYPTETIGNTNSSTSYNATIGHLFSTNYDAYRAFDGNQISTQAWTLGIASNNSAGNYVGLEFNVGSTKYPTTASLPVIKSFRFRNYGNDNTGYYAMYGSTTGSFTGEEELLFVQDGTSNSDTYYLIG